jgi:Polyketide cyclase / dehydrase and lipid transport
VPIIERHIRVRAGIRDAWDLLVDVPRQPLWMRDLRFVEIVTEGPLGVGSVAVGEVRMFGLTQRDPIRVTALDPPSTYSIAHLGAFRGTGEFRLHPLPDGSTHIRWREDLRATVEVVPLLPRLSRLPVAGPLISTVGRWAVDLGDPLLAPVFTWVFREDLRRFRGLVERPG